MAEGGGRGECPERGEGTQGGHGDGPTLWQVEGPRSAGESAAAQPPWDEGVECSRAGGGAAPWLLPSGQAGLRQTAGEAGTKQGPSRLPWACVGLGGGSDCQHL